jgi:hypothetical protein
MDTVGRGIVAGFIATWALSGLVDPLVILTRAMWSPASAFGWQLNFFLAPVIWGAGFALFHDHASGPSWLRGIVFATGAWLLIMLVARFAVDAGAFAISLGAVTLATMLLVHAAYGALLGAVYGGLTRRDMSASGPDDRLHPVAR